jgi:quercetin dioxygenase-like cupin family protein
LSSLIAQGIAGAGTPLSKHSWGTLQWLINEQLTPNSRITFGLVEIKPGCKNPKHAHPNCDEVLFLLEGEIDHCLGDDSVHLTPGKALHIPAGTSHDARNPGGMPARMIVAYSSGDRKTVWLEPETE